MRTPSLARGRLWTSLTVKFGVISAVLAAGLGLGLSTWLSNFIHDTNVSQAESTAEYSMRLVMNDIGVTPQQKEALTAPQYAAVTKLLRSMVATGTYEGAVAWGPGHLIAYAAETGRTGQTETSRPEVDLALHGRVTSIVVNRTSPAISDATERAALATHGPSLETFVPVRLGGHVVAAVEFYRQWRPVQAQIRHQTTQAFWLVTAGLAALWLGLMRLVMRASRRLQQQAKANRHLASHDPLTGLPNRQLLRERTTKALKQAAKRHGSIALLLLDLDRFKEVNDTLGHHFGDLLLQQVGPRLNAVIRDADSIARLGGDEFVILLAELDDPTRATAIAERVVTALSASFLLDDVSVDVEVSIGIATSPEHGTTFDELLQHADIAMYAAKSAGNGYATYSPDGDHASTQKLALLGQLRQALQPPSQLRLHYQPKADLVTGEVVGLEALARWQHPTRGLLPPSEFIPLAERTGLIGPLTTEVLQQALGQIRAWNSAGMHLPVSVNISTRSLDEALPGLIRELLHANRVPAAQLELEITESAVMADPDRAIAVLTRLRALGVTLSLDDFGTGYSSMAYLKDLPVQELKIDRSFITNMTVDSTGTSIVRSCVDLARSLRLTVVAEGVETAAVWDQLTELGCDFAQGYYLTPALPPDDMQAWISERSQRGESATATAFGKRLPSDDGLSK